MKFSAFRHLFSPKKRNINKLASCLCIVATFTVTSAYSHADNLKLFNKSPSYEKKLSPDKRKHLENIKREIVNRSVDVIQIDLAALKADKLEIPLDVNNAHIIKKSRVNAHSDQSYSWFGQLEGEKGSATLVVKNGKITGSIHVNGDLYKIEPLDDGLHAIIKIDLQRMPPDHPESFNTIPSGIYPKSDNSSDAAYSGALTSATSASADAGSMTQIDLLVAYTASASSATADIDSLIQLAVDEANQSYLNSGVNIHLNLVGKMQSQISETNNSTTAILSSFASDSAVLNQKAATGADVAVMIINKNEYCGLANAIMANASNAYAVVHYSCATGYFSFAHEIGHLQGARHDHANDSATTPYPYGHGYQSLATSPAWRTIMAYDCAGGCTRLQYWSNPNVTYNGAPMGTTTTNNNARVLNETANTVANFNAPPVAGVTLSNMSVTKTVTGTASYELTASGFIVTSNPTNTGFTTKGPWISPQTGMSNYEVRATAQSATQFCISAGTLNTWINLGAGAKWVDRGYYAHYGIPCRLKLEIRKASAPATTLATADINLMGKM